MTSVEGTTQQLSGVPRGEHGQHVTARSEQGQFAPVGGPSNVNAKETAPVEVSSTQNMLKHIEQLEAKLTTKEKALFEAQSRAEKFSARTREGMQSALDTLMQKWMDAVAMMRRTRRSSSVA